jgi:hypothetical protein
VKVPLKVSSVELEELCVQAHLPAPETGSNEDGGSGDNGGNSGDSRDDNDLENSNPNNHTGSAGQENGGESHATGDTDATMSGNANDERYIEQIQIKQEPL